MDNSHTWTVLLGAITVDEGEENEEADVERTTAERRTALGLGVDARQTAQKQSSQRATQQSRPETGAPEVAACLVTSLVGHVPPRSQQHRGRWTVGSGFVCVGAAAQHAQKPQWTLACTGGEAAPIERRQKTLPPPDNSEKRPEHTRGSAVPHTGAGDKR